MTADVHTGTRGRSSVTRLAALIAAAAVVVAGSSCRDAGTGRDAAGAAAARSVGAATAGAPACDGSDPHARHISLGFACTVCHPKGGEYGVAPQALPGGTQAGGTITRGTPTTCAVGCHAPFGGTPQTIAWNAGPQTCVSCHVQQSLAAAGAVRSAHVTSDAREACLGCHDVSAHMGGAVRLAGGTPAGNGHCVGCHSGQGGTLEGRTPPVLVGWTDAAGDWHGARAGSGFGGTLLAPYARGQQELRCTACHDPHVSGNAFLFGRAVNGTPVIAGQIDRTGKGAEALCASCHAGERHAGCAECHTLGDPIAPGTPCFWCHGHPGISSIPPPVYPTPHDYQAAGGDCTHCHSMSWLPAAEYVAPSFQNRGVIAVTAIGTTAATVSWTTSEKGTSWVEYGDGFGLAAGNATLATAHSVSLTGLSPGTTYLVRAKSADAMHNVARSAVHAFATGAVGAPPAPAIVDRTDIWSEVTSFVATLQWAPVASPDGDPVEYRAVVSTRGDFSTTLADSGWVSASRFDATVTAGDPGIVYYWRVVARDAVHALESAWALDTFTATIAYPSDW